MTLWLWIIAAVAGLLNPVQSGANASLGRVLGNPYGAVLVSLAVSLVATAAVALIVRGTDIISLSRFPQAPWWAWIGGFCGAFLVWSQPLAAPKLGAGVYTGIIVTAAAIGSVTLDHFGLLGFSAHPASLGRIAGAALMIAGVGLIAMF